MYSIFTGNQRSLVFPVMCNAFATIDYSANVPDANSVADTTDEAAYGIWVHEGDFTFEAIVTPYDINGYGTYDATRTPPSITASKKILPALGQSVYDASLEGNYESELYLSRTNRLTHEMMIFYSSDFQISLVNTSLHNENQPATYKIRARIRLGSTTEVIDTDTLITPNIARHYTYTGVSGFTTDGKVKYDNSGTVTSVSGTTLVVSSTAGFYAGLELFYRDGGNFISMGTIASVDSATDLTMSADVDTSANGTVFFHEDKDPLYINNLFHIACAWNDTGKTLRIYFNGNLVKTATHSQTDGFSFSREDFYIGANGQGATGSESAITNKQFMGEMHEMALLNYRKSQFAGRNNLLPNYDNTLLYLRFEEVDL